MAVSCFDYPERMSEERKRVEQQFETIFYGWPGNSSYVPTATTPAEQLELTQYYLKCVPTMAKQLLSYHFPEAIFDPKEGNCYVNAEYRWAPCVQHQHEYFELCLQLDGTHLQFVGGRPVLLQPGDVLLIPPGTPHQPTLLMGNVTGYNIGIRSTRLFDVLSHLRHLQHPVLSFMRDSCETGCISAYILFHLDSGLLRSVFSDVLQEENPDTLALLLLDSKVENFFIQVLRSARSYDWIPDPPQSVKEAEQLIHYVRLWFRTVTKADLTQRFHYSDRQISRIFRNETMRVCG